MGKKKTKLNAKGQVVAVCFAGVISLVALCGIVVSQVKVKTERHEAYVLAVAEAEKMQREKLEKAASAARLETFINEMNAEAELRRAEEEARKQAEEEAAATLAAQIGAVVETTTASTNNGEATPTNKASVIAAGSNGTANAVTPTSASSGNGAIGSIAIPDTPLNNTIYMSSEDDYYLYHDAETGRYEKYPGEVYANKCNSSDFSDYITVLYAHNMKNGSYFGCLHYYEDSTFFSQHPNFKIVAGGKTYNYTVYASVQYGNDYIPSVYSVKSASGRDSFIASLKNYASDSRTHFNSNVSISGDDKVLVCSTCAKNDPNHLNRYILVSKLTSVN